MPKTKKNRKNKRSLKNKIKLEKNKTQKNLKGGLNPKIFQIIFLLLISNITSIILSFEIKESIKNNNLTAFSEKIKFQYQFEKVVDLSNLSNLSNISIYNNFLEDPNQKALVPYIRQHEFNTKQISILTPAFNKILKSSFSIVNLNNPTIDSLVNGFVYMYQSIFLQKNQNVDMNSINTFNKFILDLIKNDKIKKLLNSYNKDDKQLVTINMQNVNEDIINLEKIFYVINDYNIKLNLENEELLNQKYDKIVEFIGNKTYKEIYDNLNESNIVFPSSLDENIFDDIFENNYETNELKKNLTELEYMINNNKSNDEINNKFMEIEHILKNNKTLVDEIKKLNQSNDDKIVKMNKIINFSVSLCTFLTKCISIMQLIMYILVIKIFIDLISSESATEPSVKGDIVPVVEGYTVPEREGEPVVEGDIIPEGEGEPVVEGDTIPEGEGDIIPEGEGDTISEGEGDTVPEGEGDTVPEGEGDTVPVVEGEDTVPEVEGDIIPEGEEQEDEVSEGEGEPVAEGEGDGVSEIDSILGEDRESLLDTDSELEETKESELLTDEELEQLNKIKYNVPDNFDDLPDEMRQIFDNPTDIDSTSYDDFLSSIFDNEYISDELSFVSDRLSSITDEDFDTIGSDSGEEDFFTSPVFYDTFPDVPKGSIRKIEQKKNSIITEDKFKKMSETMKKLFEHIRKKKLRELLKNKILRELETYPTHPNKQNLEILSNKLNKIMKKDNDIMINKINNLDFDEKNGLNKEIKTYFEPINSITGEKIDEEEKSDDGEIISNELIDEDIETLTNEIEPSKSNYIIFTNTQELFRDILKDIKLKPKLINSKIRELHKINNKKIEKIMKMIINLEKRKKLDELYNIKINDSEENEKEFYENKKNELNFQRLPIMMNIEKKISELDDSEKNLLYEEIKKYLLDDQIENEIDDDTDELMIEFESGESDNNFFKEIKNKFTEEELIIKPKPIKSKIREPHKILNKNISEIMKIIIELEKIRKINELYKRKIKKIFNEIGIKQNKMINMNSLNKKEIQNEIRELTKNYNTYTEKKKNIDKLFKMTNENLNYDIDKLTEDDKKILKEEIQKYLSEEYSIKEYLYNKYKEINKNVKKWIELSDISIRNQIDLNSWMEKLKNVEPSNTDEESKIKKIINSLQEKIKQLGINIGNLTSQMTEKEKNDIKLIEIDIKKQKYDDMTNRYKNALILVNSIESII
jgi:hypothetical protein